MGVAVPSNTLILENTGSALIILAALPTATKHATQVRPGSLYISALFCPAKGRGSNQRRTKGDSKQRLRSRK